jgi:repressor LexA
MTMGEKIKLHREQMHMTLEELGNKVGVGKSTVRKWENGMIANMRRDKISKIADALCISPAYLMGWTNNPDPNHTYSLEYGVELINNVYNNVNNSVMKAFNPVNDSKEESTTYDPNDAFYESLTDEQKAEATRLYQLFQKADSAHRLAVESLLRETPQEPERQ